MGSEDTEGTRLKQELNALIFYGSRLLLQVYSDCPDYPKCMLTANTRLIFIKSIHTCIWLLFNVIIFYFLYAVIAGKIDFKVWLCLGSIVLEGLVLLIFRNRCPLTLVARKYSSSQKANFDIYLPNWLAANNKIIYTGIVLIGVILLLFRLLNA